MVKTNLKQETGLTHHSGLFVQVDAHGSNPVGDERYEEDEDLDERHPVGEVGPVIAGISSEFPFPVRLGRSPGRSPPSRGQPSDDSHSVFSAVRVVEGRVEEPIPDPRRADVRTHPRHVGFGPR